MLKSGLKNKNGEERNKGMLLQLDGKSDRDVEAMTPEEKNCLSRRIYCKK